MLVFVHINKTAGTTVRYILRSSYGLRHCDVEPWQGTEDGRPFSSADFRRLRKIYPRLSSIAGHRVMGYVDLQEDRTHFSYFTFLREPLRMCASRFQYHIDHRKKKGLVFEEWIQRDWLRDAQTKRIAGSASVDDAIRVINEKGMFVGLTERFDESIVLLKGLRAGDLDIDYRPVNVARRQTLSNDLLSRRETREALVEANQADLALYEYATRELLPAMQREYGPGLDDAVAEHKRRTRGTWNRRRILASRLKQHAVYRPLLKLYRRKLVGGPVRTILD
jgi:hypothetical protein